jgi:hypothetical protein
MLVAMLKARMAVLGTIAVLSGCGSSGHNAFTNESSRAVVVPKAPASTCAPYFKALNQISRLIAQHRADPARRFDALEVMRAIRAEQLGLDQIDNHATPAEHRTLAALTLQVVLSYQVVADEARRDNSALQRDRSAFQLGQRTLNPQAVGRLLNRICHLGLSR